MTSYHLGELIYFWNNCLYLYFSLSNKIGTNWEYQRHPGMWQHCCWRSADNWSHWLWKQRQSEQVRDKHHPYIISSSTSIIFGMWPLTLFYTLSSLWILYIWQYILLTVVVIVLKVCQFYIWSNKNNACHLVTWFKFNHRLSIHHVVLTMKTYIL